jgi:hypothetical protein
MHAGIGGGGKRRVRIFLGQRTALRRPTRNREGENGHVRSFSGSYHDEECILTSVIGSASDVSEGADDAEVIEVEVENGAGCDEIGRDLGTVVVGEEEDISSQREWANSGGAWCSC